MRFKNIIQDELKYILIEGKIFNDENQDFDFKQVVENATFQNYESMSPEYNSNITESNVIINWKAGFWLNQMGIENFNIDIQGIGGQYKLELRHKQSEEVIQEIVKNIDEIEWKFIIENAVLMKDQSLYADSVNFDFQTHVCKIKF